MAVAGDPIRITSFGVDLDVRVDAGLGEALPAEVEALLPPGAVRRTEGEPFATVALSQVDGGFLVDPGLGEPTQRWASEAEGLHGLDAAIRAVVSLHAPEHVFIHAGVVGLDAGALVLPGRSFAGKTTLVTALIAAGATYLSDEYAVLEADGTVLPYPRRLSVRAPDGRQEVPAERLGATVATGPSTIVAVAELRYRAGAAWAVEDEPAGACALALLDNAVAARSRSAAVLAATAAVARRAAFVRGERGEVAEAAERLLARFA